jgi:hypothetical protein
MVADQQHVAAELAGIPLAWAGAVFQVTGRFG